MTALRVGAVGYLNTRPLVRGLDAQPARFSVRFDVPARCAELLHSGEVDVGLIPSIEYLRGDYVIVPGVSIASHGAVASVALFTRRPLGRVRTIALDTSSRTSAALTRILCAERWGIAPAFTPRGPDLAAMLREADAALLIGDPALFADHRVADAEKVDLGAEWTAMTGLPFVWAVWAAQPGTLGPEESAALAAARDAGVAAIDEIAREYAPRDEARRARAAQYLREHVRFSLDEPHRLALGRYFDAAVRLGLVPAHRPLRFAEVPVGAGPHADLAAGSAVRSA